MVGSDEMLVKVGDEVSREVHGAVRGFSKAASAVMRVSGSQSLNDSSRSDGLKGACVVCSMRWLGDYLQDCNNDISIDVCTRTAALVPLDSTRIFGKSPRAS